MALGANAANRKYKTSSVLSLSDPHSKTCADANIAATTKANNDIRRIEEGFPWSSDKKRLELMLWEGFA